MSDDEVIKTVRWIRRLQLNRQSSLKRAIVNGLIGRLEDNGVTEGDLDRLGL